MSSKQIVLLGDIARIRRGASPRPIQDFIQNKPGVPWVKIADATAANSRFIYETKEYIKPEGSKSSVTVSPETLIMSNSATPGLPMIMKIEACVHDGWLILDELKGVDRNWLYYFLLNRRELSARAASGSVFSNLKTDIVRNFKVALPELDEQTETAKILWIIDEKIELNRRMNETLEQIGQTLFRHYFITNPNAKKWATAHVSDLGEVITGKTPSKARNEYYGHEVPFLKVPDMHNQSIVINTADWLSKLGAESQKNKYIPKWSTCVSCIATVGVVSLAGEKLQTNQQINSIIPRSNEYRFFNYYALLEKSKMLQTMASGGSATPNLNKGQFEKIKITLPPIDLLTKFNDEAKGLFERIDLNSREVQALTILREALLPRLISGKLTP